MNLKDIIAGVGVGLVINSYPLIGLVDRFTAETKTVIESYQIETQKPPRVGFGAGMYPRETYHVRFNDGSNFRINYFWDEIYPRPKSGDQFRIGDVLGYFWGPE